MHSPLYRKTKEHYEKRVFYFIFFSTKMLKRLNSSQWRHRTTLPEPFFFFFTFLSIETPKCIQSILYEETKGNYEKCVMSVFEFLRYQKAKKRE